MGKFETVPAFQLLPSQDFLKENTVRFIFQCRREGNTDDLPPEPIVRHHPQKNQYIAIDGHNKIAVWDYAGEEITVYVVDSASDCLPGDSEAIAARNADLAAKFDSALTECDRLAARGMKSFIDLEGKYPELFTA